MHLCCVSLVMFFVNGMMCHNARVTCRKLQEIASQIFTIKINTFSVRIPSNLDLNIVFSVHNWKCIE